MSHLACQTNHVLLFQKDWIFYLLSVPVAYSEHGSLCIDPLCKQRPSRYILHVHFHNLLSFLSARVSLIFWGCVSSRHNAVYLCSVWEEGGHVYTHPKAAANWEVFDLEYLWQCAQGWHIWRHSSYLFSLESHHTNFTPQSLHQPYILKCQISAIFYLF